MKHVLFLLVIFTLVFCQPQRLLNREERQKRRRQFQKDMKDCILKNESASVDLKTLLEGNNSSPLTFLHYYFSKLDSNDKEIIKKCRGELFEKLKELIGDRIPALLNITKEMPFLQRNNDKKQ